MPKNVQMPDGTVMAFPDNMDDAAIHAEGLKYINKVMAPPPPVDQRAKNAQQITPVSSPLSYNPTGYLQGSPQTLQEGGNNSIEVLRNILPPAAGAAAGIAATPYTGGLGTAAASNAAYTGVDALLKQLKFGNKETIPESLKDSLIQAAINEAGGKVTSGVWKGFKGVVKPAQEEFLKYLPTAAQALNQSGEYPTVAKILKLAEDYFAPGSKVAAQERSAAAGAAIGEKLYAKTGGRSVETVTNPNTMVKLITGEMVPEEQIGKQRLLQRTADYQPIEFGPGLPPRAQTPIRTSGGRFGGSKPFTPGTETTTRATGPIEQVPIPGAYEIIPGVVKKVPFATDPASLDNLLTQPDKLQKALTQSQAAGLGTNVRQDLAGYRLSRIQQAATEVQPDGGVRLNTQKLFAQMDDPEMASTNKILFGSSKGPSNIRQFYKNMSETQGKSEQFGGFRKLRFVAEGIGVTGGLATALITGNAAPVAVALAPIGVEFGVAAVAKALTNPKTARLMLALANNDALGVSDQYAARILMQTLTNATGNLVNKDGSKTPFVIKGGQMVPLQ